MNDQTFRDREILSEAHDRGLGATFGAFLRLSGPGWLQSAITLGGGSLGSALYLGMLGGTGMLWVQLVAIVIGVVMLSAISYVTLSSGERPYAAMNKHINPVLGTAWITATIIANMVFILAQFSLCFDSLQTLLLTNLEDTEKSKLIVSGIIGGIALVIVLMSYKPGMAAKLFDWILKLIVGFVVLCFVGAVVKLFQQGNLDWNTIGEGFKPESIWESLNSLSPQLAPLTEGLDSASYWTAEVNRSRQTSMIAAAAAAVGINMTFLLPYSMLARGWDRTFRGLARWDLITGMAIPFIVVTSCIVLASANAFHAKIDDNFKSNDVTAIQQSRLFKGVTETVKKRMLLGDESAFAVIDEMPKSNDEEIEARSKAEKEAIATYIASMSEEERIVAATLVKPNTEQLATTLEPALGDKANFVFGLGVLGMGFSTIIILMLINGYAFAEILGAYENNIIRVIGALAAVLCGFFWFWFWTGDSKTYLVIIASSFAAILLPIAYFTFMALMNNRQLLGDEKPTGARMSIWNLLMTVGVLGAVAQSVAAISTKIGSENGPFVIGGVVTFLILALVGFSARPRRDY